MHQRAAGRPPRDRGRDPRTRRGSQVIERSRGISAVWFFCLGGLGSFFPFYSLYLHENAALSGSQVGQVLAMLPLMGIVAQPFWGWVADRSGSRTLTLALLGVGASLGYAALSLADGFAALLLGTGALAVFSTALIPSCVAVTLAVSDPHRFGWIRMWGTIGFFVNVVAFPRLLDFVQAERGLVASAGGASEPGLELMFPVTAMLVLVSGLLALRLPRTGSVMLRAARGDWKQLLRHGPFVRVLLFTVGAYLCLHGPTTFFPVFVRSHGGSLDTVSNLWVLMLVVEVPLVALSGAGLARIGARGLLAVGVVAGGLRWLLCGLMGDTFWIYPIQLLHGVVIAGLVIGAPLYVEAVVPERLRSTGQGILAMLGVSLGGIISNLTTGAILDRYGPDFVYVLGGLGAIVLGSLVPLIIPPPRRSDSEAESSQA